MNHIFITGATGLLGAALISELAKQGYQDITAFIMKGDPLEKRLPPYVKRAYGNVLAPESIAASMEEGDFVIHLAAIVSIQRKDDEKMKRVNVEGTKNVVDCAIAKKAAKLVYVSSSHVLSYHKDGSVITEKDFGGATEDIGAYETTKKEATAYVFAKAKEGLNASVVFPSGIISDEDYGEGEITTLLYKLSTGKLTYYVKGGYAFVDVHDVARVIIAALFKGKPGEGYLASGGYMTLDEIDQEVRKNCPNVKKGRIIPFWVCYMVLPFIMLHEKISGKKPLYTYMSLKTVRTKANFSTEKAEKELGIKFTPLSESIRRSLLFVEKNAPK